MNKITVEKNKIYINNQIKTNEEIIIGGNNTYQIEYQDNQQLNLNITIQKNSNINLFIVNKDQSKNININYNISKNSSLTINKFYYKNELEETITINLNEENSKITYNFSTICTNTQKYKLIINHKAKATTSIISNRIVTVGEGKVDFQIDSNAKKGTSQCKMDQSTKIITTNDVKSTIKPNMFIDEYDVEAKHASTVGTIKEDQLFYLMSRGVKKSEALKLIIKGYLISNINKNPFICANIINIINKYWR